MLKVCDILITDNVVDIIFHVFDANGDGNLNSDEFVRVVQRRERDNSQPRADTKGLNILLAKLYDKLLHFKVASLISEMINFLRRSS